MHKTNQFKNIRQQNSFTALSAIFLSLFTCNLFCQSAQAAPTKTITPATKVNTNTKPDIDRASKNARKVSTGIATLRVYTKASDLKSDSLIKNLLKSAVSADSPDSTPDAQNKAAALNLNVNETIAANLFRQNTFDLNELVDIDKDNFILGNLTRGNTIHLAKGNALFVPPKDIVVIADLAEINIKAGSMVGVLRPSPDIVSIYDLEDTGSKKVTVKVGNELLPLAPGKNLIISREANEFEKINPAHRIAYRKLESKKLKSGFYAYTTEFSISSAVLHVKPLQNILLSDKPEDRKIADRLLKNYVILEDVFSSSEPFKMPASIVTPVKISSKQI